MVLKLFFFFFLSFVCLSFGHWVSLCVSVCPAAPSTDHARLELSNPPASASRVLGWKAWPPLHGDPETLKTQNKNLQIKKQKTKTKTQEHTHTIIKKKRKTLKKKTTLNFFKKTKKQKTTKQTPKPWKPKKSIKLSSKNPKNA